jgi:hypothetical protein
MSTRWKVVTRFAAAGTLVFGLSFACTDDDALQTDDSTAADAGNDRSAPHSGGAAGSGGSPAATGGAVHSDGGGAGELLDAALDDGHAEAAPSDAAAESGTQIAICPRLVTPDRPDLTTQFSELAKAHMRAVLRECRVRDSVATLPSIPDWLNALNTFGWELFGCSTKSPTTFALVGERPGYSRADVELLIEIYVATVDAQLGLTVSEEREVEALLTALSSSVVTSESDEYSYSTCSDAGAAGAAGVSGAGGAGGAPGSAGAAGSGN